MRQGTRKECSLTICLSCLTKIHDERCGETMQDFEKLGAFYLGRAFDLSQRQLLEDPILYDSKDLTTHGVCVGMTGSGKTGLCISLLEEAAIDSVPGIIIDPKGDVTNLLLNAAESMESPGMVQAAVCSRPSTSKPTRFSRAALWGRPAGRIRP